MPFNFVFYFNENWEGIKLKIASFKILEKFVALEEAEECVYFKILPSLFHLIIEKKEPLSKHIYFFDTLRKKVFLSEKVNYYKSQFDVKIINLIWLVENGYFDY